jgi:hypothetical protein
MELWIKIILRDGFEYKSKISTRQLNQLLASFVDLKSKVISFGDYRENKEGILSIDTFFRECK